MKFIHGVCVFVAAACACTSLAPAQIGAAGRVDVLWHDTRIPAEERRMLERSLGFAPPAIEKGARWLSQEKPTWDELRGKVVVIQTWTVSGEAGRTAPTRAEEALKDFKPDEVALIALHTPQGADNVDAFLKSKPLSMPVALDAVGSVCDDMGIWRRPTLIVLDKSGKVRATGVALPKLGDAVKFLLAENHDPKAAKPETVPSRNASGDAVPANTGDGKYPPAPGGFGANDLRGKPGPAIHARSWLTPRPEVKNKVVILDFWATWCRPCVAAIPHMNETQEKFKDSVVVIGISNESETVVRQFMRRTEMKYTVATDDQGRMMEVVNPRGIPHVVIMSPDGVVRWQGHPGNMSDALIQRIIEASGAGPIKPGSGLPDSDTIRWVRR